MHEEPHFSGEPPRPDDPVGGDDARPEEHESAYDLLQRGHALLEDHHNAQAAVVLERAARLEPGKASILEALGRAYFNSAQTERSRETFEALADLFSHHRGDKPVTFQLLVKDQGRQLRVRAQVSAHIRVKPTSALVQEVEKICGAGAVALR